MKNKLKDIQIVEDKDTLDKLYMPDTAFYKCSKCFNTIEADYGAKQEYCDYCECVVFLDKLS